MPLYSRKTLNVFFLLITSATLLIGVFLTWLVIDETEADMNLKMAQKAQAVASALNPDKVSQLKGDESDLQKPEYQRIKENFCSISTVYSQHRLIYLLGRRPDNMIYIQVDSAEENSSAYSPPGTNYEEAPLEICQFFETGLCVNLGPYTDRWGTWHTAYAPLFDDVSGKVLGIVGIDVDAAVWNAEARNAWIIPVLFTLALLLVFLASWKLLLVKSEAADSDLFKWRHLESGIIIVVGGIFVAASCWMVTQHEKEADDRLFKIIVNEHTESVSRNFKSLRDSDLDGIGNFFEASDKVTIDEFRHYTRTLVNNPAVQAWEWVAVVDFENKEAFEKGIRNEGQKDFFIWQMNQAGQRIPVEKRDCYYPVTYAEPSVGNEMIVGYDAGSEPTRFAALLEAIDTRLITATDPITLHQETGTQKSMLVFRPVYHERGEGRIRGFATVVLRLGTMVSQFTGTAKQSEPPVVVELYHLHRSAHPELIASTWEVDPAEAAHDSVADPWASYSLFRPQFEFGQSLALFARPGPGLKPFGGGLRPSIITALVGIFLSLTLAFVTGLIVHYRTTLESTVRQRTADLSAINERFNQLTEHSRTVAWECDQNGLFTYVSEASEAVFGCAPEQLINKKHFFDLHPEAGFEEFKAAALAVMEKKESFKDLHNPVVSKNGQTVWVSTDGFPILDAEGNLLTYRGTDTDITDRKLAEEALQASEARFRDLFMNSPDAFVLIVDGVIQDCNNAAQTMVRGPREQLIGKTPWDISPECQPGGRQSKEKAEWIIQTSYREGFIKFEWVHRRLDGSDFWADVALVTLNIDGKPSLLTSWRDITARKNAEEALRASEARFHELFMKSPDPLLLFVDEVIIDCNDRTLEMLRGSREQIIGLTAAQVSPEFQPDGRPSAEKSSEVNLGSLKNRTLSFEWLHKRLDGSEFWVDVSIVVINVEGIDTLFTSWKDITDRKKAEEEREKLQAQLIQSQKMESVGRLAGGVAHDFNNMLQAIIGYSELALSDIEPDTLLYSNVTEIQKAAARSADLTQQLLAFARKQTIAPKVLDLNETVSGTLKMLRRLIGEDIDLSWIPGSNLWPIKFDPTQINQILTNLAVNARDAIQGVGKLTIETHNIHFEEAYTPDSLDEHIGAYVMLAISDTGSGMSKEILSHLFEPFFTTKGLGKGTGLGLATCYGIIKQNHGFIKVYSEPGIGTTFKIFIPPVEGETLDVVAGPIEMPDANGETVLLVEDEEAILNITRAMLQKMGYQVFAAASPEEAIRLAHAHSGEIDLLITDVVMPGMDGVSMSKKIQQIIPAARRLYMSGYTNNLIVSRGILTDARNFLQKPFSAKDLALKIRHVLQDPA